MSLYHTLVFIHVLGAFSLVAGTVALAPFALNLGQQALERSGSLRLGTIGAVLYGIGAVLTIVFGLWLVAKAPQPNGTKGYDFFRFWIIGALVLWGVAGWANGELSKAMRAGDGAEHSGPSARTLWYVTMISAALILVLMIWKPGH